MGIDFVMVPERRLEQFEAHVYEEGIDGFTLADLVELFCDWRAAVRRHNDGSINRSIDINQERFNIDDQLHKILKNSV